MRRQIDLDFLVLGAHLRTQPEAIADMMDDPAPTATVLLASVGREVGQPERLAHPHRAW